MFHSNSPQVAIPQLLMGIHLWIKHLKYSKINSFGIHSHIILKECLRYLQYEWKKWWAGSKNMSLDMYTCCTFANQPLSVTLKEMIRPFQWFLTSPCFRLFTLCSPLQDGSIVTQSFTWKVNGFQTPSSLRLWRTQEFTVLEGRREAMAAEKVREYRVERIRKSSLKEWVMWKKLEKTSKL